MSFVTLSTYVVSSYLVWTSMISLSFSLTHKHTPTYLFLQLLNP